MKIAGIIPARYKSSRFPGKPLVPLLKKPMVIHVAELVSEALGKRNTYVATESDKIASEVAKWGYQVVMTGEDALTGTDRVWQASKKIDADIFMNIQGDEPLLDPKDIKRIAKEKEKKMDSVINGMHVISPNEDPHSINIPKVVTNEKNYLVYMSRLPIPGFKDDRSRPDRYYKQVCIYAFSPDQLEKYGRFARKSRLEESEDIEILRFFELSIPVYMVMTGSTSLAVDVPADIPLVEAALKAKAR